MGLASPSSKLCRPWSTTRSPPAPTAAPTPSSASWTDRTDVDHPDVKNIIETKVKEGEKIRALRDAGFDPRPLCRGPRIHHVLAEIDVIKGSSVRKYLAGPPRR
jgi:hypothetical protein